MAVRAGLDVVIVSYRCRDLLRQCLNSLRTFPPARPMSVLVVDNGSTDGTVQLVRDEFPEVQLFPSSDNLGFSAANNIGIRAGDAEYVLALNPDARITDGALESLLQLMDARRDIGIVGPRLEREDGTFDHAAKRSFPTPASALGHFTGLGRRPHARGRLAAYRAPDVEVGPVDAVNGAFMLMRRQALDEVGTFDEGYWMYMEDLDLCYRFRAAGWITWYEPSVTVVHIKAGTSGTQRSFRLNRAFHYGMYRFYRKHYARTRSPVVNLAVYIGIGSKLVLSALRSLYNRRLRAIA